MPKIPTYERKIQRTAEGAEAYSLPAERSSPLQIPYTGSEYRGMAIFAERVTRIGTRLQEADRVEQFSRAVVAANDGLSSALHEIQQDPALMEAPPEEYERELSRRTSELKAQISGQIRDVPTRDAFGVRFDDKVADARVKVRALGRDRMISRGRAATDEQLDHLVNSFIRSGDPSALAEGGAIITAKRAAGYFTAQEAVELGQKFSRHATVGYWQRRILDAPAAAYEILKSDPESIQGLPEADRTHLLAQAKGAADAFRRDAALSGAYADLYGRNGRNFERTLAEVNNPANWSRLGIDYATAKELDGRFRTMLAERERMETLADQDLAKRREQNTRNVLVDYYSGKPVDVQRLDELARVGAVDQSVYKHIREGGGEAAHKDDPFTLAAIAQDYESGRDITRSLQAAVQERKITNQTYVQYVKSQADRDYKEGLSIVNKVMQPSEMDFNYDKRHAWGEAVELYNMHVRNGYHPRVASSMVLDRYKKAERRTLQGLPRPKYIEGNTDDMAAVDRAVQATVERFRGGMLREDEYRFEMQNLERIKSVLSNSRDLLESSPDTDAVRRQIEASKKAAR